MKNALEVFKEALLARDLVLLVEQCKSLRREYAKADWQDGDVSQWLVGIDSETDRFPTGPERRHWNSEALARLDDELNVLWGDLFEEAVAKMNELTELVKGAS